MVMKNLEQVGPSSFGAEDTTTGPEFSAQSFWDSKRRKDLESKWLYFCSKQHDYKKYDWDGRMLQMGVQVMQPLMTPQAAPYYVPLKMRRPSSPYRLPRVMITSFTSMLLGEHRFPKFMVAGAPVTQDYVKALADCAEFGRHFQRMRNFGGATGTMCASWSFIQGKPRIQVHNAMHIHVPEWEDRDETIPRYVVKCYQYEKDVFDPETRKMKAKTFWYRRDWTLDADIIYQPCEVKSGMDPVFIPDWDRSFIHKDKLTHFVWGQNLPSDDDGVDGESDIEGLYDNFDSLDILLSVITKGAILNLDPTLKLKMDPDLVNRMGMRKGSENALIVGEEGDADYMELAGTSLKAGIEVFNEKRGYVLEVGQCVIPDPDQVAANGTSSVAIKAIYKPMTDRTDIMRDQYGPVTTRLLEPMLVVAKSKHKQRVIVYEPDENGVPEKKEYETVILLPPKIEPDPSGAVDENGELLTVQIEREPGDGKDVKPEWGPYFLPTPTDRQAEVTTLTTAIGQGKPILSRKTAVELAAAAYGKSPEEELDRIAQEQNEDDERRSSMFADAQGGGGAVKHKLTMPSGETIERHVQPPEMPEMPEPPPPPEEPEAKFQVPPTFVPSLITVNEARQSLGLQLLPGDDGVLSLAAYAAKYSEPIGIGSAAVQGKPGGATPPESSSSDDDNGMPPAGGVPPMPPHGGAPPVPPVPPPIGM